MSKLEEVSSKQLVLIDSFDARINHFKVFTFTLLISVVYAIYLWFVCSTIPGIISALLLFGSQIIIGFPATRTFYDMGISNREKLHFIDPYKFTNSGQIHDVEIHIGDISLIFEKFDFQIRKYDAGSLDDLNDLAWFGILVWAGISSTSFYLGTGGHSQCLVGALILFIACCSSYLSGYWTSPSYGFEDDLNHLQYYIERRFKKIDKMIPKTRYSILMQILEKWRSLMIFDFSIEINLGGDSVLEYHLGVPSSEKERIVVKATSNILDNVYDESIRSTTLSKHNWSPERLVTAAGPIVRIVNESSNFSITTKSSFVTNPSMIDESSEITAQVFSEVLSFTNQK
jgi:hypothetical protein